MHIYDKQKLLDPVQPALKLLLLLLGLGMGLSLSNMMAPALASAAPPAYTLFESGEVRPLQHY